VKVRFRLCVLLSFIGCTHHELLYLPASVGHFCFTTVSFIIELSMVQTNAIPSLNSGNRHSSHKTHNVGYAGRYKTGGRERVGWCAKRPV
jgi:hypothetical protein